MAVFCQLFKFNLRVVYFILKLFPIHKNKIVFISRQSNEVSIDFQMIAKKLNKYKVVILTKKIESGFFNYIKYYFHLYKQMYHLATSKVCIIDSYCIPACILKHKKNLTIIQIWHAMGAIKQFGYQTLTKEAGRDDKISHIMCMHKNYDYVLSGSKSMIEPFSEAFSISKDKIIVNGLPRIDYIINNKKILNKKIKMDYKLLKLKKNVLYVPTFRRNEEVKINALINNFDFDKFNLIIKLHPSSNMKIKNKKVFTCSGYSSLELLTIADYIITDYSAISIEAASLDIPVYLYLYDYDDYVNKNGLNIDLFMEFGKYASKDIEPIIDSLKKEKYDMNVLYKFKEKYLDLDYGKYTDKLVNFIINIME